MATNRREFLTLAAGAAAAALMPGGGLLGQSRTDEKRAALNLLIVTADDLNCDSCGWMGSTLGATPNLDEFAKSAYGFAQAHSAAPICQPSREAIMTGRVPHRSGAFGFDPVNKDVPTLWELLKASGYFTAGIHKLMHMAPPEKFNWDWRSNGGKNDRETGRNPAHYFDEVSHAIELATKTNQPFFINANINDPHRPFYGTEQDKNLDGVAIEHEFKESEVILPGFLDEIPDVRKEVTRYFNSVRRFDQSFGNVMRALQTSGQADRTIVVFCSDHGMSFPFSKTTIYKNGTWTPLLIRAPGASVVSVDRRHMVSNIDVMPTVLELLNIKPPEGMDGRSLTSILKGGKQENRDHVFTHMTSTVRHDYFPSRCIRTATSSYIFNTWSDGRRKFRNESMSGLTFKAMQDAAQSNATVAGRVEMFLHRRPQEFYDLARDPHERKNEIDNPDYHQEIGRLKELLHQQMKATNDPLLKDFPA